MNIFLFKILISSIISPSCWYFIIMLLESREICGGTSLKSWGSNECELLVMQIYSRQ